jgi:hypothetical protein
MEREFAMNLKLGVIFKITVLALYFQRLDLGSEF